MRTIKTGFSLVELLVVISIIGVLIGTASVNFITAQKQARDSRRLQDLEGIQTSLETYFAELQAYPTSSTEIDSAFDSGVRPTDPKNDANFFYDWTHLTATGYCVCAHLEARLGNASAPTSEVCIWDTSDEYFCIQNRQ